MGLEPNALGQYPDVAPTAFVHPTAVLIGHVVVDDGVYIGPHAVIRADEPGPDGMIESVAIGRHANVQDGVMIHALGGTSVTIGSSTSIAHGAVVHGPCEIGNGCFVGFMSVVFRARLDDGVIVLHRALVENVDIGRGQLVPSAGLVQSEFDVRQLAAAPPDVVAFAQKVSRTNVWLAQSSLHRHQAQRPHFLHRLDPRKAR